MRRVLIGEFGDIAALAVRHVLEEEGLTADGRVLGTTDYVSPEQALGHAVTGQSDIYSLGIALFEMLTGDVPFKGDSQVAVAMRHVREELPDVQLLRPEVSASLAAVAPDCSAADIPPRTARSPMRGCSFMASTISSQLRALNAASTEVSNASASG